MPSLTTRALGSSTSNRSPLTNTIVTGLYGIRLWKAVLARSKLSARISPLLVEKRRTTRGIRPRRGSGVRPLGRSSPEPRFSGRLDLLRRHRARGVRLEIGEAAVQLAPPDFGQGGAGSSAATLSRISWA